MIINHLILTVLIFFLLLAPASQTTAYLITGIAEAIAQIKSAEGNAGLEAYKIAIANLINLEITDEAPVPPAGSFLYPGFRVIQNGINQLSQGRLVARYSDDPIPTVFITNKQDSSINLKFQFVGKPYALRIFIWSFVVILIVSCIAAYWIATRVTAPLQSLSEQARELAEGTELRQIAVQKNSSPEIRALTDSLNHMRAALDQMINEREQLLANITHDLRTPLSRLTIGLELVKYKSPQSTDEMLGDVSEMGTLLDQFVELSKLNQEVDEPWIFGQLNDCVTGIRDKYRRAGIEIEFKPAQGSTLIRYKPTALARLMYNLIDNAVRHGTGNVRVEVTHSGDHYVSLVVMNSVTPGPNKTTGLTQSFHTQGDKNRAGLGLKIIRQFTKVHDATLRESFIGSTRICTVQFKIYEESA